MRVHSSIALSFLAPDGSVNAGVSSMLHNLPLCKAEARIAIYISPTRRPQGSAKSRIPSVEPSSGIEILQPCARVSSI